MQPCNIVEIETRKKYMLNGLLFGTQKPKRVIIWIHGLGSSVFSKQVLISKLAVGDTAVLNFNNRGHDSVVRLRPAKSKKNLLAGAAFEKFEDCIDDIQGAIDFVKKMGVKEIYLAGHSTGCQKAVFWAGKGGSGIEGIILLAPMSDYAGAVHRYGKKKIEQLVKSAQALIKKGQTEYLMPSSQWSEEPDSPGRFVSLYTPDSVEQSIFSYFDETRKPKMLSSVKIPLLVILAEKDEYADRAAVEIAHWFEKSAHLPVETQIVSGADHGFKGHEDTVATAMRAFID